MFNVLSSAFGAVVTGTAVLVVQRLLRGRLQERTTDLAASATRVVRALEENPFAAAPGATAHRYQRSEAPAESRS